MGGGAQTGPAENSETDSGSNKSDNDDNNMSGGMQTMAAWQKNELKQGRDFSVGPFETTPTNMTENATLGWGPTVRRSDDFSTCMRIKSPRWVMFSTPRAPQENESRFDVQLCFPVERPKNFPYTDAEIESCRSFVKVMQRFNAQLFEWYLQNCRRIVNWETMRVAMGYGGGGKKGKGKDTKDKPEEIPEEKMREWIENNASLRASVFDVPKNDDNNDDDEIGMVTIQDTKWYKIKVKMNAEMPPKSERKTEVFVFGGKVKKEGAKFISIVTNATLAKTVYVDMTVMLNGKKETVDVWPQKGDNDDDPHVGEGKLRDVMLRQQALQKFRRQLHERVGTDPAKIFPRGCTGQSVLNFSHLMRKLSNSEACPPIMRIFANQHVVIHPPERTSKKAMELDDEIPDDVFENVSTQDDEFFAVPSPLTTTTADDLFGDRPDFAGSSGNATKKNKKDGNDGDDGDNGDDRFKKFKKQTDEPARLSIKEMKEQLSRKAAQKAQDD